MEQILQSKTLSAAELGNFLKACLNKTERHPTASAPHEPASSGLPKTSVVSETDLKSSARSLVPHTQSEKQPVGSDMKYTVDRESTAESSQSGFRRTSARVPDHERLYISIREIDLNKLFENTPEIQEFASVRNSLVYEGNFYGQWTMKLMRRIQDKFNYSIGNIRWVQSILRSSSLPLDVPLLKRDVTRELASQIEWAIIEELLGNVICSGESPVESTSFQSISYEPKSLQDVDEVLNYNFEVIDHSDAKSRSPSPLEVVSGPDSYHPSEYCPEQPLLSESPTSEKHFEDECEGRPRSKSPPSPVVTHRISQDSNPRDESFHPHERYAGASDKCKSGRQYRRRRLSYSNSESPTSVPHGNASSAATEARNQISDISEADKNTPIALQVGRETSQAFQLDKDKFKDDKDKLKDPRADKYPALARQVNKNISEADPSADKGTDLTPEADKDSLEVHQANKKTSEAPQANKDISELLKRVDAVRKKAKVLKAQPDFEAEFPSINPSSPISEVTSALSGRADDDISSIPLPPSSSNLQVTPTISVLNTPMAKPTNVIIKEPGPSLGPGMQPNIVGPNSIVPWTNTMTTWSFALPPQGPMPPLNLSGLIPPPNAAAWQVPQLVPTFGVPVQPPLLVGNNVGNSPMIRPGFHPCNINPVSVLPDPRSFPLGHVQNPSPMSSIFPNIAMPVGGTNPAQVAPPGGSWPLPVPGLRIDPADPSNAVASVLPSDSIAPKPNAARYHHESHMFKGGITIDMNWIGSAGETIQRFMPKTSQETFDYVGFFIECFHRMAGDFRTDLRYVAMLVNSVLTIGNIRFIEPQYQASANVWQASITVYGKSFFGVGHIVNSAILNSLGLAFPLKVAELRDFAREQGFLGWKLGRKQYHAGSGDVRYDALRAKLWTELNKEFFLNASSTAYCQKDGQVVYKKLSQVMLRMSGNSNLLVCTGPVCVDVQTTFIDGNDKPVFTGTHFSASSASLALISSMFHVSLQMKFLDDVMLLLGEGCLKGTPHNQMVTDFYWDLLLARTDFLSELCQVSVSLDPVVGKMVSGSIGDECAKVLACLVADDGFYYALLGWILGQTLKPESYHRQQFFKMWALSRARHAKAVSISQTVSERTTSDVLSKSKELGLIQSILKRFADPNIFIWKVCQSSYSCHMIETLLSEKSLEKPLYSDLMYYACKIQDHIGIRPYTPLCAQAMLGNDTRPLAYENMTSITGLILDQAECERRDASIRSICQDKNCSKLADIIRQFVTPDQFEPVLNVLSRDVLFVPAIEQLADSPAEGMRYIEQHKWWHVAFWQSLVRDAADMPDLRCPLDFTKSRLSLMMAQKPTIPPLLGNNRDGAKKPSPTDATSTSKIPKDMATSSSSVLPSSALASTITTKSQQDVDSLSCRTWRKARKGKDDLTVILKTTKQPLDVVPTVGKIPELPSIVPLAPNDKIQPVVNRKRKNKTNAVLSVSVSESHPDLSPLDHRLIIVKDVLELMAQQKVRGPAHKLIMSTPGWTKILESAIRNSKLSNSLLKEVLTYTDDTSPMFCLFAKEWERLLSENTRRETTEMGAQSLPKTTEAKSPQPKKPLTNVQTFIYDSSIKITITWKDSLVETLDRFMPKTAGACFDLAGFFMECFDRMSEDFRANLSYVAFIVNECVKLKNCLIKPNFYVKSKIWHCGISVSGQTISGYGRCCNTAILNALGSVCSKKITDLRSFARNHGLIGWKSARNLHNPFTNVKLKVVFWKTLNDIFYLKQTSAAYYQSGCQMVYENLKKVTGAVLGSSSLLVTSGSVCVDAVMVYKDTDSVEKTCIGTHFSTDSASLTLICSIFSPTELMKFLDDLMLLLGGGSLKQDSASQMAIDFYWDLLLARIDFLNEVCQLHNDVVKSYFDTKNATKLAKIRECLVADDSFYFSLLGWLLEGKLQRKSMQYTQFLKMWSIAECRCERAINLFRAFSEQTGANNDNVSDEFKLIRPITEACADPEILVNKMCQSTYLYEILMPLPPGQRVTQTRACAMEHACSKVKDCITVSPYASINPEVILGNPSRPFIYHKASSVSGLIFDLIKCERYVAVIELMCCENVNSEFVEIINRLKSLYRFEVVMQAAARDIFYEPAIKQWNAHFSQDVNAPGFIEQEAWTWHIDFWRTLTRESEKIPDLRWPKGFARSILRQWTMSTISEFAGKTTVNKKIPLLGDTDVSPLSGSKIPHSAKKTINIYITHQGVTAAKKTKNDITYKNLPAHAAGTVSTLSGQQLGSMDKQRLVSTTTAEEKESLEAAPLTLLTSRAIVPDVDDNVPVTSRKFDAETVKVVTGNVVSSTMMNLSKNKPGLPHKEKQSSPDEKSEVNQTLNNNSGRVDVLNGLKSVITQTMQQQTSSPAVKATGTADKSRSGLQFQNAPLQMPSLMSKSGNLQLEISEQQIVNSNLNKFSPQDRDTPNPEAAATTIPQLISSSDNLVTRTGTNVSSESEMRERSAKQELSKSGTKRSFDTLPTSDSSDVANIRERTESKAFRKHLPTPRGSSKSVEVSAEKKSNVKAKAQAGSATDPSRKVGADAKQTGYDVRNRSTQQESSKSVRETSSKKPGFDVAKVWKKWGSSKTPQKEANSKVTAEIKGPSNAVNDSNTECLKNILPKPKEKSSRSSHKSVDDIPRQLKVNPKPGTKRTLEVADADVTRSKIMKKGYPSFLQNLNGNQGKILEKLASEDPEGFAQFLEMSKMDEPDVQSMDYRVCMHKILLIAGQVNSPRSPINPLKAQLRLLPNGDNVVSTLAKEYPTDFDRFESFSKMDNPDVTSVMYQACVDRLLRISADLARVTNENKDQGSKEPINLPLPSHRNQIGQPAAIDNRQVISEALYYDYPNNPLHKALANLSKRHEILYLLAQRDISLFDQVIKLLRKSWVDPRRKNYKKILTKIFGLSSELESNQEPAVQPDVNTQQNSSKSALNMDDDVSKQPKVNSNRGTKRNQESNAANAVCTKTAKQSCPSLLQTLNAMPDKQRILERVASEDPECFACFQQISKMNESDIQRIIYQVCMHKVMLIAGQVTGSPINPLKEHLRLLPNENGIMRIFAQKYPEDFDCFEGFLKTDNPDVTSMKYQECLDRLLKISADLLKSTKQYDSSQSSKTLTDLPLSSDLDQPGQSSVNFDRQAMISRVLRYDYPYNSLHQALANLSKRHEILGLLAERDISMFDHVIKLLKNRRINSNRDYYKQILAKIFRLSSELKICQEFVGQPEVNAQQNSSKSVLNLVDDVSKQPKVNSNHGTKRKRESDVANAACAKTAKKSYPSFLQNLNTMLLDERILEKVASEDPECFACFQQISKMDESNVQSIIYQVCMHKVMMIAGQVTGSRINPLKEHLRVLPNENGIMRVFAEKYPEDFDCFEVFLKMDNPDVSSMKYQTCLDRLLKISADLVKSTKEDNSGQSSKTLSNLPMSLNQDQVVQSSANDDIQLVISQVLGYNYPNNSLNKVLTNLDNRHEILSLLAQRDMRTFETLVQLLKKQWVDSNRANYRQILSKILGLSSELEKNDEFAGQRDPTIMVDRLQQILLSSCASNVLRKLLMSIPNYRDVLLRFASLDAHDFSCLPRLLKDKQLDSTNSDYRKVLARILSLSSEIGNDASKFQQKPVMNKPTTVQPQQQSTHERKRVSVFPSLMESDQLPPLSDLGVSKVDVVSPLEEVPSLKLQQAKTPTKQESSESEVKNSSAKEKSSKSVPKEALEKLTISNRDVAKTLGTPESPWAQVKNLSKQPSLSGSASQKSSLDTAGKKSSPKPKHEARRSSHTGASKRVEAEAKQNTARSGLKLADDFSKQSKLKSVVGTKSKLKSKTFSDARGKTEKKSYSSFLQKLNANPDKEKILKKLAAEDQECFAHFQKFSKMDEPDVHSIDYRVCTHKVMLIAEQFTGSRINPLKQQLLLLPNADDTMRTFAKKYPKDFDCFEVFSKMDKPDVTSIKYQACVDRLVRISADLAKSTKSANLAKSTKRDDAQSNKLINLPLPSDQNQAGASTADDDPEMVISQILHLNYRNNSLHRFLANLSNRREILSLLAQRDIRTFNTLVNLWKKSWIDSNRANYRQILNKISCISSELERNLEFSCQNDPLVMVDQLQQILISSSHSNALRKVLMTIPNCRDVLLRLASVDAYDFAGLPRLLKEEYLDNTNSDYCRVLGKILSLSSNRRW